MLVLVVRIVFCRLLVSIWCRLGFWFWVVWSQWIFGFGWLWLWFGWLRVCYWALVPWFVLLDLIWLLGFGGLGTIVGFVSFLYV